MVSKAIVRYVRLSPRKTRLVVDMIRGKNIADAQAILSNLHKKATVYVSEVLKSAVANAKRHPEIEPGDLYVSKITVDGGPMLKRYRAGSMGRAMHIAHRTSHILIELDVKKQKLPVKEPKKPAAQLKSAIKKLAGSKKQAEAKKPVAKKAVGAKGK